MKVLIDTCVAIDFLQKREPFADDALRIFRAAASELFAGYITDVPTAMWNPEKTCVRC